MSTKEERRKTLQAKIDKLQDELKQLDDLIEISELQEGSSFSRPSGPGKTHSGEYQQLTRHPNCYNSETSAASEIRKLLKTYQCVLAFNDVSIIVLPENLSVVKK